MSDERRRPVLRLTLLRQLLSNPKRAIISITYGDSTSVQVAWTSPR